MPDEPPDELSGETEEQLEERLRKLLGEAEHVDPEEIDEIELKLRDLDDKISATHDSRKEEEALFDAEFEERLKKLHEKADSTKTARVSKESERKRNYASDRSSAKGLATGMSAAYAIIGFPLVGLGIGWLIDSSLHTTSGKGIGVLIGAAAGMTMAMMLLKRANEQD